MSFLLDALGKAETDRDQGQIPELKTPASRRKSPFKRALQMGLLLCLLLASFALGFIARPYFDDKVANVSPTGQIATSSTAVSKVSESLNDPVVDKPTTVVQADKHPINISAISYSENPEIRFVMLNNSVMYEGDELVTGERIVRIEQHGVVLEKAGQQKRIGLSRSR
jgi:hypothetical protein